MTASVADRIGTFVGELEWSSVPPEIADRARDRVLDAISTAAAGGVADPYQPVRAILEDEPAGKASVLASGETAGGAVAAFANGVAVHALLYEDLNLTSADHPGAVIVPAALAGQGAIARGFRTTSVFGAVAGAVAAAKAMRLSPAHVATAATIGANFSGGLMEGWSHGSHEPYLQAGMAAEQGLRAAQLAASGAVRAAPTFEGKNGFLRAFADAADDAKIIPGSPWRIMQVICKPYPCSGGKIGAIDSARELRDAGLDATQISRVRVWLPALYYAYPGASRVAPFGSMSQAQASGQFCVAATLLGYDMESVETFLRDFRNDDIAALSHKVELLAQPGAQPAKVEVTLSDGTVRTAEADGRDRQLPTIKKMADKLKTLTAKVWPPGAADAVLQIATGDIRRPVSELSAQLRR